MEKLSEEALEFFKKSAKKVRESFNTVDTDVNVTEEQRLKVIEALKGTSLSDLIIEERDYYREN